MIQLVSIIPLLESSYYILGAIVIVLYSIGLKLFLDMLFKWNNMLFYTSDGFFFNCTLPYVLHLG